MCGGQAAGPRDPSIGTRHRHLTLDTGLTSTLREPMRTKCTLCISISTTHAYLMFTSRFYLFYWLCPYTPSFFPQCSVQCRADLAAGGYIDSIRGVFLEHCLQQPQPWQRRQPGEDCWLYNCPPANVSFAYMAGHVYTLWSIIASVWNAFLNIQYIAFVYS